MESVVLVIHLFLALAIILLVLLQRSEGGGLVNQGGGMGGLASPRGTANMLTRATAICALCFFCTSLLLAIMAGQDSKSRGNILDALEQQQAIPSAEIEVQKENADKAEGKETPAPAEVPKDAAAPVNDNTNKEGDSEAPSPPIAQ